MTSLSPSGGGDRPHPLVTGPACVHRACLWLWYRAVQRLGCAAAAVGPLLLLLLHVNPILALATASSHSAPAAAAAATYQPRACSCCRAPQPCCCCCCRRLTPGLQLPTWGLAGRPAPPTWTPPLPCVPPRPLQSGYRLCSCKAGRPRPAHLATRLSRCPALAGLCVGGGVGYCLVDTDSTDWPTLTLLLGRH